MWIRIPFEYDFPSLLWMVPLKNAKMDFLVWMLWSEPVQYGLSFSRPGMTMSFHVLNCSLRDRSPSGVMKMDFLMFRFQSRTMCGPRAPATTKTWSLPCVWFQYGYSFLTIDRASR